ncbi:ankyrin repeat domain-containing protein 31 [Tachyglossus aculeatus]|uniref:ankyrin repeat domain-containing protein 31 n=1 Tax=Tachyglossus aculeatus TaxID=9261 RepID=UPI0018F728BC|nr:ankyrin repeat domain-containing protein 31 [Tachyglossus aculeatus]
MEGLPLPPSSSSSSIGASGGRPPGRAGTGQDMEEGRAPSECDSDETIVSGSLLNSDLDEDELNLNRLTVAKASDSTFQLTFRPAITGIYGEVLSSEAQYVDKEDLQEQMTSDLMKTHSLRRIETEQPQPLLPDGKNDMTQMATFPPADFPPHSVVHVEDSSSMGLNDGISGFCQRAEMKENNWLRWIPEAPYQHSPYYSEESISLRSTTPLSYRGEEQETSLRGMLSSEPDSLRPIMMTWCARDFQKIDRFQKPLLSMGGSPELVMEEIPFQPRTLAQEPPNQWRLLRETESPQQVFPSNPSLDCVEEILFSGTSESENNDDLSAELQIVLKTLSDSGSEPTSQGAEKGSGLQSNSEPSHTQTDNCGTQNPENNLEPECSVHSFEAVQQLAEAEVKDPSNKQVVLDSKTLAPQNVISCGEPSNEKNSDRKEISPGISTATDSASTARRSSRLKTLATRNAATSMDGVNNKPVEVPEKPLPYRIRRRPTEDLRTQDPVVRNERVRECSPSSQQSSSTRNSGEEIRRSKRIANKMAKEPPRKVMKLSNINRRDIYGDSLLHKAAARGDSELVRECLKLGANVNRPNYAGWTALHEASVEGYYKTVHELLKRGADVNCKGMGGTTPIQDAVQMGHLEVTELLLQYGADPLLQNDNGACAMDTAEDPSFKRLLENYIVKSRRHQRSVQENTSLDIDTSLQRKKLEPIQKGHVQRGSSRKTRQGNANVSRRIRMILRYQKSSDPRRPRRLARTKTKQSTDDKRNAGPRQTRTQEARDHNPDKTAHGKTRSTSRRAKPVSESSISNMKGVISSSRRITRSATQKPRSHRNGRGISGLTDQSAKTPKNDIRKETEANLVSERKKRACGNSLVQKMHFKSRDPSDRRGKVDFLNSECAASKKVLPQPCRSLEAKLPVLITGQCRMSQRHRPNPLWVNEYDIASQSRNSIGENVGEENVDGCISVKNLLSQKFISYDNYKGDDRVSGHIVGERNNEGCSRGGNTENHSGANMYTRWQIQEKGVRMGQDLQETFLGQDLCSSCNVDEDSINWAPYNPMGQEVSEPSELGKGKSRGLPTRSVRETTTQGNERNAQGENCLHSAAEKGDLTLAKALIESGARVNQQDHAGRTGLHEASKRGFTKIIVELLKAGANVNSNDLDGISPLHDAVSGNHLKAAEILLRYGANPKQKDDRERSALDEATDEKMKMLLKSFGPRETRKSSYASTIDPEGEETSNRSRKSQQCYCHGCTDVDLPSFSNQDQMRNTSPTHESISAILQDIEEKQENLLQFEIRTHEDSEQYSQKMLQIKAFLDDVLAKQKEERDKLAKRYRTSKDSFRAGALKEKLTNLASRQKRLLVVAHKQREVSHKIQNFKTMKQASVRQQAASSGSRGDDDKQNPVAAEKTKHPSAASLPLSPATSCSLGSSSETQLFSESRFFDQADSQSPNSWMREEETEEVLGQEECSLNDQTAKRKAEGGSSDHTSTPHYPDITEMGAFPLEPVGFISQTKYSKRKANHLSEIAPKESESPDPSAKTRTSNISGATSEIVKKNSCQPTAACSQAPACWNSPGGTSMKAASQEPSTERSERSSRPLPVDHGDPLGGREALLKTKPDHPKSTQADGLANDSQNSFTPLSPSQPSKQQSSNHRTERERRNMRIRDLMLQGKIMPGEDVLEFKMQNLSYKASILPNGKVKDESGNIYISPIAWIKQLLGSNIYVTWKYVWNKVTYLGKELSKYVSEEVHKPVEPKLPPPNQPCPPAYTGSSSQWTSKPDITHILQLKEMLLISNQELLPSHMMDQQWQFYVECEELAF